MKSSYQKQLDELKAKYGMTAADIVKAAKSLV